MKENTNYGTYESLKTITHKKYSLMNTAYTNSQDFSFFSDAKVQLEQIIKRLQSNHCHDKEHGDIEKYIDKEGREIFRCLLQGWLDIKNTNEVQYYHIHTENEQPLNHVKPQTKRKLTSLFGHVSVKRTGYSQRQQPSQFPLDAELNLANDQYSDGTRYRLSKEVIRGSFDNAIEAINETTGAHIAKRQSLNVIRDIAQDYVPFYKKRQFNKAEKTEDLLILTFDGKGIVMRPEGLRACTQKAAKKNKKLNSRLSPGEKKDRKRMAQVAAVYTVLPHERSAQSIMKMNEKKNNVKSFCAPARNKRVWASVEREAESVIEEAFLEALQRDPEQNRKWVVLIDGLPQQIRLIKKIMKRLHVETTVVMDFIHVLEYLWKAAWCFFEKGDEKVEKWIAQRAVKILNGQCSQVAKGIRLSATRQKLEERIGVDKCADYLLKNKERLQYGEALKSGFPIASGVIEGACRHLINDRLDITGARWSLQGAEAVLILRSLKSSGDFEEYWSFHKQQSKKRHYGFLQHNEF